MVNYYDMIFKRKSFHSFKNTGDEKLTSLDLKDIEGFLTTVKPLVKDIKVKFIIDKDNSGLSRGQEYNILFYSEKKDNYLQNIGYIGEQLDLYLVSKNIGTLWNGLGKTSIKELDGLSYVIMMSIKKVDSAEKFRKDTFKLKRKPTSEIWSGKRLDIANIVKYAPSACNTQPWLVEEANNKLCVYRVVDKFGIIPKSLITYYNQIDIGIFLCFLEVYFAKNKMDFIRVLHTLKNPKNNKNLTAEYTLQGE